MILVRKFRPTDLGRVYNIERRSFKDPYHVLFLMNLYDLYPEGFFVVEKNGMVIGYVISREVERSGHVVAIAVAEDHRRNGIGGVLMRRVAEHFLSVDVKHLWLEVRVSNEAAIKFYKSLGFGEQTVMKGYYSDGEDAVILERWLSVEDLLT